MGWPQSCATLNVSRIGVRREMKNKLMLLVLAAMLVALLGACGGGAAPETPVDTAPVAEVEEQAPAEVEAEQAPAEEPAAAAEAQPETTEPTAAPAADAPAEEPAVEEPAAADASGDLAMSGTDADTGLEINPAVPAPGIDYIVRGKLVSFNLTPQDSPEFLIESPDGVRYRIRSQPVPDIYFTDGTQLKPHEYKRGLMAQATARLEDSSTLTSVMLSENLTLFPEAQ